MLGDITIDREGDALSKNRKLFVYVEGAESFKYDDDTVFVCVSDRDIGEMFGEDFECDEAVLETLDVMGIFEDAELTYIEGEMRCEFES